ncbi:unnamed protein product [Cylindrotheca closterium]|uniref:Integrase catalytic domain-containing protein n=1 Tax=Cylindrotheca closterium TaxID=2856 RepID=A0AAD2G769_9STRA|nr:unnamed protein product [Cylindrotheca closterium]
MSYTPRSADVYAYDPALPPTNVPIVSGATAYDCPQSGNTFILIFNEALYYGNRLDHSLINPNQVRKFGIPLWDNPFDEMRNIGIETKPIFVALKAKGTKLLFDSRAPTDQELANCPHIDMTSKVPWNPGTVQLGKISIAHKDPPIDDPRSNEAELRQLDPIMQGMNEWRTVQQTIVNGERFFQQVGRMDDDARFADVPVRPSIVSTERHTKATAENLSERLGIGLHRARATLRSTLQRGTRSAILPLARRYRADRMFLRPRLKGKFSTDTAYFNHKSIRGNIASQIYFHKSGFYSCHHLSKVDDKQVGPTLKKFIADYGIPEHLTMDGAAVQVGRNTSFMETINRAAINYHISRPYRPEENPAEGGIRELKRRFYRLIVKHAIPERLWDFVLDYVVDTMNITANYSRYSDGRVPLEVITGITPDITEYMDFTIYGWVYYRTDGALGPNEIGRWLGVSHRTGPMMTYWILPRSGRPISTDTVQNISETEKQTDVVKEQMAQWTTDVSKILDARTGDISWGKDEIPPQLMFDLGLEDKEFKCNFNELIKAEDVDDGTLQGTTETDNIDAQNCVNMEIGLRRGQEGELQRAVVRRRIIDAEGNPIGVANNNQELISTSGRTWTQTLTNGGDHGTLL